MLRSTRFLPGALATLLVAVPLAAHPAQAAPAPIAAARKPQTLDERRAARAGALRTALRQVAATRQRSAPPPAASIGFFDEAGIWRQTGLATWYGGPRWQWHPTASGARFDQDEMTAAHPSLPLGSRVTVHLLGTERSIVVTINDRPGTRHVVIDLSRAAARKLGILNQGVARVELSMP